MVIVGDGDSERCRDGDSDRHREVSSFPLSPSSLTSSLSPPFPPSSSPPIPFLPSPIPHPPFLPSPPHTVPGDPPNRTANIPMPSGEVDFNISRLGHDPPLPSSTLPYSTLLYPMPCHDGLPVHIISPSSPPASSYPGTLYPRPGLETQRQPATGPFLSLGIRCGELGCRCW